VEKSKVGISALTGPSPTASKAAARTGMPSGINRVPKKAGLSGDFGSPGGAPRQTILSGSGNGTGLWVHQSMS